MLSVLRRKIANIVGTPNVKDSSSELKKNSSDASVIASKALLVAYPKNKEQIVEIVKLANESGVPIVIRGGGSGLCGGATAQNSLVINMTRMDRILEISPRKRYVITQPGILLDSLNRKLQKSGMYMPVHPASHDLATIGGMIATNAGGEHVLRFGRMIDNLISIEAVSGKGDLIHVKGDSLGEFCGTEGIIGVVVEAKIKIMPSLGQTTVTVRRYNDAGEMMKDVRFFIKNKKVIACECINPKLFSMSTKKKEYLLLVEFLGDGGEVKSKREAGRYWKIREGCYDLLMRKGWSIATDPYIPPKNMPAFLSFCDSEGIPAFGHVGHGVIHAHLKKRRTMDKIYLTVMKLSGEVSGEHGIGITKKKYLATVRKTELKKLKKLYDPNSVLNKGKVI